MSSVCTTSSPTPLRPPPPPRLRRRTHFPTAISAARSPPAVSNDLVLRIAEQLEDSVTPSSPLLQPLRSSSSLSLLSTPWPTRRSGDAFRFTDLSYPRSLPISLPSQTIRPKPPSSPFPSHLLFADGLLTSASCAFAGALTDLPPGRARARVAAALSASAEFSYKDLFYDLNAVGARDVAVVYVPEGVQMADEPIHIMFTYSGSGGGSMVMSNPRVLVVAEKGAEVAIVEEHSGVGGEDGGCYWANPVVEIIVDESARVVHSYVQRQAHVAAHTKWTVVHQNTSSSYEFVEDKQIQDLHSRLILDHPRGYSRQLHKCIACGSGNGVFDGNIRVNRYAQQTDAGQETKCLLLSPNALVNVKPNLQIIADDVKCTHGAAISGELDPNELLYFQTRGVDLKTAMDALVFSFGAHVIRRIPFKAIEGKTIAEFKELLSSSRQNNG